MTVPSLLASNNPQPDNAGTRKLRFTISAKVHHQGAAYRPFPFLAVPGSSATCAE
jgi:hypothetical protein